ncbi:MAG: dipeptidase [Saprospiraceae bacterium]|uniref:Dipeptidase n=1 Tax=Candidatus Opimibacter skivensis TaxID=2982028 RepID=A0A9D7SSB7_9BACT|nr:dipeptidase [Candidatus Opimibacter skivensis]
METVQTYIKANQKRFLDELIEFLRIPSISADTKYQGDVLKAATWLSTELKRIGMDGVEIIPTKGHPVVFAEKKVSEHVPTILVYGHYDVQPVDPLNLWNSPPFEPVVKDEKIWARGSCDDKGQVYMHVKALEAMIAEGQLTCNVKVIFEGEEEVGSVNLGDFLEANKKKLSADVVLVSDTSIIANDVPSITTGLRGLSYVEVEVTGPNKDLHSGVYGGAVANPCNVLCTMIAGMHDENRHITIPGFYEDVDVVPDAERRMMNMAPFNEEDYKQALNVNALLGEKGYTTLERTSIRPTLDVNGIWGGYIGEGAKTVLPSKAFAKISMRLVPHQDSDKITELFSNYFKSVAPPYVQVKVTALHGGQPAVTPTDTIEYKAASAAMKKSFGKEPLPQRSGGSIPIVALFESILGIKTVLLGFGLDSDDIHSPNEHFGLFNFYKGIATIPYYYMFYAEMNKK